MYRKEEEVPEYEEGRSYTNRELELMANKLLKEQARSEVCRECGEHGVSTGDTENSEQEVQSKSGEQLVLAFEEYECKNGHRWYLGEGKERGIGGENPILFEEHIISRKKREIFNTNGIPDPEIVSGIYNRVHPGGRKVNTDAARRNHGASFYR